MKKILNLIVPVLFVLSTATGFAATKTGTHSNWICTTNASSASAASDKKADDKMARTAESATKSFAYATKNCRDCTKITCEIKSK